MLHVLLQVSNISDGGYIGIHRTLASMTPLLEDPRSNPHATLITLFMNAIEENMTDYDRISAMSTSSQRLLKYLPLMQPISGGNDPDVIKRLFAVDFVTAYDHIFDRYLPMHQHRYLHFRIVCPNTVCCLDTSKTSSWWRRHSSSGLS